MCFSDGTGSNVFEQLDQFCMVSFLWILSVTHVLFILHPQSIVSVPQVHFRGRRAKDLPSVSCRDKGPVSFISQVIWFSQLEDEFRLRVPLHSLKAGLLFSLGQCAISCIYLPLISQILHCLLSSACTAATYLKSSSSWAH